MMWNAVVLAGDRNPKDPVARAGLTPFKAMAPVGDRRLIAPVVRIPLKVDPVDYEGAH